MMELWPFTNFHDLNLDWIIRTIKVYAKKVDDLLNTGLYDYVEEVLTAHPEWTTTVMDGAITKRKLYEDRLDSYYIKDADASGAGDTVLHVTQNGETLLIDIGTANTAQTAIIPFMQGKGLSHVDKLVLTHYHADHCGGNGIGIGALISAGYIDNDTVVYLPHGTLDLTSVTWSTGQDLQATKTAVINALNTSGCTLVYPATEGEQVTMDNIRITFLNVDPAYWSDYMTHTENKDGAPAANGGVEYNNFSTVTLVENSYNCYLNAADIYEPTQNRIHAELPGNIVVFKIEHHGNNTVVSESYLKKLHPRFAIACCSIPDYQTRYGDVPTMAYVSNLASVYVTGDSGNIHLEDSYSEISCKNVATNNIPVNSTGIRINGAADLNNIIQDGNYQGAATVTLTNAPKTGMAFSLTVETVKYYYKKQTITYMDRTVYYRIGTTDTGVFVPDYVPEWTEIITSDGDVSHAINLTTSYTTNSFITENNFNNGIKVQRYGDMLVVSINISAVNGTALPGDFTKIGKIENVTLENAVYLTIPAQDPGYAYAMIQIQNNGDIRYYSNSNTGTPTTTGGNYRGTITAILKYYS